MLIYSSAVYHHESAIVPLLDVASWIKSARMGIVTDVGGKPNALGPMSGPPFSVVIAFAAVRPPAGLRRVHRVLYLSCADPSREDGSAAHDGSDNIVSPLSSFVASEPLTKCEPWQPLKASGPEANHRIQLRRLLAQYRESWQIRCKAFGMALRTSSVDRFGETYQLPTY